MFPKISSAIKPKICSLEGYFISGIAHLVCSPAGGGEDNMVDKRIVCSVE